MAEEMIFEYKPMDSKMFHSFENVKNTEHKLLSIANENCIIHQPQHNSAIFGFQETTPTKVAENASVIMDLEPVKTKGNAIIQIKEVEDLALHGYTPGTSEKPDLSLETTRKDAEERSRLLSPADAYFITKKVGYSLCSPSFQEQQGTSSVQDRVVQTPKTVKSQRLAANAVVLRPQALISRIAYISFSRHIN
ncbi:hypothetical protein RND71_032622 [Anisodus tanguticus]|uniref:Uncharacterized protein n=1 Tax=Anisodus tanguticus TaxID=243964 RepID=A0AAE1UVF2_9SOLA|nr:hypothetical protein RND71_032622 [Anisodus tanguticus]